MNAMKRVPFALSLCLALAAFGATARAADAATAKLRINLRASPDLASRIMAILDRGDAIEVIEERGEFVKVRKQSGSEGYVKRKYLNVEASVAQVSEAPAITAVSAAPAQPPSVVDAPLAPTAPVPSTPATSTEPVQATAPAEIAAAGPSPWYVYGMAGVGFATDSPQRIQRALDTTGGTVTLQELRLTVPAFELAGGYRFAGRFSVELGLLHLGTYQGVIRGSGANTAKLRGVLADHYPGGGTGAALSLGATTSAGLWSFGGRAGGFCSFDSERPFRYGGGEITVETEPCAPLLGLRVGNAITPSLSVGLGANAVFFENRQYTVGLTLQYR